MQFTDALELGKPRRTKEGYLAVRARAARAGVYDYLGSEVDPEGAHFKADQVVKVYRPEEEVFAKDAVHSFLMKPITDNHPSVPVTADNWKQYARGVAAAAIRDGDHLAFDLLLMDVAAIEALDSGKRELSNGYACELEIGDGTAPDGTAYQATQRTIRGNHIALVDKGRAGPTCRISDGGNKLFEACDSAAVILDALKEPKQMSNFILHDGLKVDLSDADAVKALVAKLQGQITDANTARETAAKALTDATAEHDKAMGAKDAEIEKLKEQIVDETKIDELADAKAEVVGKAKAVLGDKMPETKGKSIADVRRAAVAAKFGDAAVTDKSDDYVEARFDAMTADAKAEDGKPTPFKAPTIVSNDAEVADAYNKMVEDMRAASAPKAA